jgi:CBS-domain-containing membrane protein
LKAEQKNARSRNPKAGFSVQHVARVLLANRISAVPVVGKGDELLGIVGEGDLLRIFGGWHRADRLLVDWQSASVSQILAEDFVKSHATKVSDIMSGLRMSSFRSLPRLPPAS